MSELELLQQIARDVHFVVIGLTFICFALGLIYATILFRTTQKDSGGEDINVF